MKVHNKHQAFDHVEQLLYSRYSKDPAFDKVTFILGYNMTGSDEMTTIIESEKSDGHKVIAYQLEQLYHGSRWVNKHSIPNLRMMDEIWDYDTQNIMYLMNRFDINAKLRPMLYCPELVRIPERKKEEHNIDILFYGSMNDARSELLTYIAKNISSKHEVTYYSDIWGAALDDAISRSKIVLNLHYYPTVRQEQVRMFYLVSNNKCVLSEFSEDNYMGNSIVNCRAEDLPRACDMLLHDDNWYKQAKSAGARYRKISEEYIKRFR